MTKTIFDSEEVISIMVERIQSQAYNVLSQELDNFEEKVRYCGTK